MERCANCAHLVESHNLSGCFAGDEEDEVYRCSCPFDYDGKGTFNSKQLPTAARERPTLRNDANQCRGCLAPEGAECTSDCLLGLAYSRGRVAGQLAESLRWCTAKLAQSGGIVECTTLERHDGTRAGGSHGDGGLRWFDDAEGAAPHVRPSEQGAAGLQWCTATCDRGAGIIECTRLDAHNGQDGQEHCGPVEDGGRFRWFDWSEGATPHRPVAQAAARHDQVGGDHYRTLKIQPWDIVDEYALDHYRASALKYVLRADRKGKKLEDLRKAVHCLRKAIEIEEGKHV